ncbi:4-alpha-glucanotransferase [Planctomycetes bacterium K23_9]|uniref:4-alpha-glucanotransferase n=1 Tax=Stieleria marina TaxID=1930275 RepID=A0A517NZY1_9BACT|nr:4-alpha-glucanotransferase [Planctomycetes bacterium K23_9]
MTLTNSNERAAGVLLHVTSLPSEFGIGDMGPGAWAWIDRLSEAGQSWWQLLPLGPIGPGNSPYSPFSTFAGNVLLLSPERLAEEGLLSRADCVCPDFPKNDVDFDAVSLFKLRLLDTAWQNFSNDTDATLRTAFETFCQTQSSWLDDYALLFALQQRYRFVSYLELPDELLNRDPAAMARSKLELADSIDRCRFGQFLFFRQWNALRQYAGQKGVRLIGDLPFFVSANSADVWSHPEIFLLDKQHKPTFVAGVPPDYFSDTGQLWGNPVYNWQALQKQGYRWWIQRIEALLSLVDVIRLDHFRAFAAAWHVPTDATTAESGEWLPGPAADFFEHMRSTLGRLPFVAEDLGLITDDVHELRDQFQLPGTRVLQFAFDGDPANPFLTDNYPSNTVAYTGTHDNDTTRGWYESLDAEQLQIVQKTLKDRKLASNTIAPEFIRLVWSSQSTLAIAPLQDILNLGTESKMNVPGTTDGNWQWRCTSQMLDQADWQSLRDLTDRTGRLPSAHGDGDGDNSPLEVR